MGYSPFNFPPAGTFADLVGAELRRLVLALPGELDRTHSTGSFAPEDVRIIHSVYPCSCITTLETWSRLRPLLGFWSRKDFVEIRRKQLESGEQQRLARQVYDVTFFDLL